MRHSLARFFIMSKDPAFLFYSNDFLTGTYLLSDEQVGKYIRLLCLQHQKGVLSEKDMLNVCKTHDEDIFAKFEKNEQGFYNVRLKEEADKRKAYSESRKNNRKKKDIENISKTYVTHMENENENEDINIKENKVKLKNGFMAGNEHLGLELTDMQIGSAIAYIESTKRIKIAKETMLAVWHIFKIKEFTGSKWYNNEGEIYTHFINSLKYEKFEESKLAPIKKNDDKAKKILGL